MSSAVTIHIGHRFHSTAERVFAAWLTPVQAARFFFRTRTGNVMRCEIDPVVGGGFLVTDRRPVADGDESVFDVVHRGRYLEIERPNRLVFELTVSPLEQTSRVTIELQQVGTLQCDLKLAHELEDSCDGYFGAEASRRSWLTMLALMDRELFPKRVGVSL